MMLVIINILINVKDLNNANHVKNSRFNSICNKKTILNMFRYVKSLISQAEAVSLTVAVASAVAVEVPVTMCASAQTLTLTSSPLAS